LRGEYDGQNGTAAAIDAVAAAPVLKGRTVVLVDVSGSMGDKLSGKSDMTRLDAAAALASVVNAEHLRVFAFSNDIKEVPPRRGMAGVDAIKNSMPHQGTELFAAVAEINSQAAYDRIVVITDEQAAGPKMTAFGSYGLFNRNNRNVTTPKFPAPVGKGYMINVASAQHGVGYGAWTHLDGFSEFVIRWINEFERSTSEK
jgi:hypothetical protein